MPAQPKLTRREKAQEQADERQELATGLLLLLAENHPVLQAKTIRMGTLAQLLTARLFPATNVSVGRLLDQVSAGRALAGYISAKKIHKPHVRDGLETIANPPEPEPDQRPPQRIPIKPLPLRLPATPEPAGNGNGNGAYSHRRG